MSLTEKAGSWFKSSTPKTHSTSTCVGPGNIIEVGEFFWITNDDFIGYDSDAKHGHGLSSFPGSVDVGCKLEVRAANHEYAIVCLKRPCVPYGALAPIGTVFQIPLSQIIRWPGMSSARREHEKQREALRDGFVA